MARSCCCSGDNVAAEAADAADGGVGDGMLVGVCIGMVVGVLVGVDAAVRVGEGTVVDAGGVAAAGGLKGTRGLPCARGPPSRDRSELDEKPPAPPRGLLGAADPHPAFVNGEAAGDRAAGAAHGLGSAAVFGVCGISVCAACEVESRSSSASMDEGVRSFNGCWIVLYIRRSMLKPWKTQHPTRVRDGELVVVGAWGISASTGKRYSAFRVMARRRKGDA
eukprot:1194728-Pleurochrysis_carterae.AAC.2